MPFFKKSKPEDGTRYLLTARDGRRHITRAKSSAEAREHAANALGCGVGDIVTEEAVGG